MSRSPLRSLWDLQGVSVRVVAVRTWHNFLADNLLGRAAELGFYFIFALFPTLFCASSLLGLAARSASNIYDKLLHYLAVVIPHAAMGTVLATFNETTAAATSGKLTFGIVAALWSASVGFSAIQDSLNTIYKVTETRSYFRARFSAIGVTIVLAALVTVTLASMLASDFFARLVRDHLYHHFLGSVAVVVIRSLGWMIVAALITLFFAVIYYWAPDVKKSCWRWLTPGSIIGIALWILASIGFRVYLHFFDNFSVTYGSLGAVIILLTWFYITGLTLLLGAEINSQIEMAAAEKRLLAARPSSSSSPKPHTSGDPSPQSMSPREAPSNSPA
ncbi:MULTISPECIES: YihY/virulence factor BrkB family protein [Acidobacteriaceae]|uniref:YihY/virulence factor BrkB family protein n=1 Tax=Acidobacteriaceae TaxID=204434 RepID=UPI0020B1127B|nr:MULTISPECIES: YihY/virulence factor BrkB family protein [Acidobacteriaceae]MDW5264706.1 YihY/virulence factor BrkB family protein [Edaphobacter sp.]